MSQSLEDIQKELEKSLAGRKLDLRDYNFDDLTIF